MQRSIRMLLIEDNPGDAQLVEDMLVEAPDICMEAADCLHAGMERISGGGVDLCLLDLGLPECRDLETLERVLACAPALPVVVLTGQDDDRQALMAVKSGAQDYLSKNALTAELLRRTIRNAAERGRMEQQIKASLREKEVLLKEIHHRVKNNMQIISSLLSLKAQHLRDPAILRFCDETRNRIKSMSLVHERLYRSHDFSCLDFGEYLESILLYLVRYHPGPRIDYTVDAPGILLGIEKAVPCGLIINELVSNALTHAFHGRESGIIAVRAAINSDASVTFSVSDDGTGLHLTSLDQVETFGLRLVRELAAQIGGTVEITGGQGTTITVTFREEDCT